MSTQARSMSEEDHSLGSDAAASADDGGGELPSDHIDSTGAHREEDESESIEDEESTFIICDDGDGNREDEGCSAEEVEDEEPDMPRRHAAKLVDYFMPWSRYKVTFEGLRDRVEQMPAHIVRKAILDYNILHRYVGYSAPCDDEGGLRHEDDDPVVVELEVVEYLIELSPDAVNKADDGREGRPMFCRPAHPQGRNSYPLHLACFNADCPVSVICLLLKKNPSAIEHSWDSSYGLPLNCYLARTGNHPSDGNYEDWGEGEEVYIETCPAFPSGELDIEILRMLIDAYPEALGICGRMGTPIGTLCEGFAVSFKLAKMLMDEDYVCLQEICTKKCSPIVRLLYNTGVQAFPDDLFRYLLECNPDSLQMEEESDDDSDSYDPGYESNLYLACSNSKMTAETVAMIIEAQPEMVKRRYKFDGCLPLHRLCQNSKLEEQAAIDILNLLVSAYPESVKQKLISKIDWTMLGRQGGEFPIHIADEYNMPFGFCKALLTERTRQSSLRGANILQTSCINKCSLMLVKKVVEDNSELLLMKDDEGHVALHTASKHASLDVVKYLVEQNVNALSVPDNLGELPLHKACREGKLNVVEYLMTRNAESMSVLNHRNRLPVYNLCSTSSKSASLVRSVEYNATIFRMLKARPKRNIMQIACVSKCSLGMIKSLVEDDRNILMLRDEEKHVALHSAAKYASLDVVKYLVEQNELGLTALDHARELPLHKACRTGKFDIVEYLIAKNPASVTVANRWNELPLHTCEPRSC